MNAQEFSHLGGSGENWKYSRLVGMDGRIEMQGCKIGITQGQVGQITGQKYSRLVGRVERLKILKVRWKGWKVRDAQSQMERMNDQAYSHLRRIGENWKYSRLVGMDERLEMLKVMWQGCKIGITQGQV